MISVKIYDPNGKSTHLELPPETRLDMEFLLPSFDDDLNGSEFSLPIRIPFTDHNRKALSFADHFNTSPASIPDEWRCDVYDSGMLFLQDAKLKLLNLVGRFDAKDGAYNFNISGTRGLFGSAIKGKTMKDLELDGPITWAPPMDSREFAKDLMDGNQPQYEDRISFAPVAMTDFFDTTRSGYSGEFIIDETVNNIVVDAAYNNGWIFGRYKPVAPTIIVASGAPGYEDYRTVPFYNLFYVLRKIFSEHGFTAEGSFFSATDFEQLFIFNNYAIEKYAYPSPIDQNLIIEPSNHMPKQLISDFLASLQNTFNLKFVFKSGFKVQVNFKDEILASSAIVDQSEKISLEYQNAKRHPSYLGYALRWNWDANDRFHSDWVKDMKDKNIVAEVNTLADLIAMPFGFTLDDTHYALVTAENYYYRYNTTIPGWEAYSENQWDIEQGTKEFGILPMLSPLCQHYGIDIPLNQIVNKGKCCTRMFGTYLTVAKEVIENPFETRIFYIQKQTAGGYTDMPFSLSHNYDTNGVKLVETSLSWKAVEGLYSKFWHRWIEFLRNSFEVSAKAYFNVTDLASLNESDVIRIYQSMFLLKKYTPVLPIGEPTNLELVKI